MFYVKVNDITENYVKYTMIVPKSFSNLIVYLYHTRIYNETRIVSKDNNMIFKGYYLFSSDTSVRVGMNTMCVNKKSSKHGSFLEPATFVLLSLCSSRCSRIFCGVPAMIMYLEQTAAVSSADVERAFRRGELAIRDAATVGCGRSDEPRDIVRVLDSHRERETAWFSRRNSTTYVARAYSINYTRLRARADTDSFSSISISTISLDKTDSIQIGKLSRDPNAALPAAVQETTRGSRARKIVPEIDEN